MINPGSGQFCFLLATLQALSATPEACKVIENAALHQGENSTSAALAKHLRDMHNISTEQEDGENPVISIMLVRVPISPHLGAS